jgi:hypothetical protein
MATGDRDQSVLEHINALVAEEEQLYARGQLGESEQERLASLRVELDRCWDLLRQRRALREFGKNPDEAKVRPASVVENYEQ